jgi:hypothetical protein
MITAVTQRWRQGRTSYLPRREVIRPAEFEVAPLTDDSEAKLFIIRHHYSRSYPAARRRFGLYRRSQLVGCAVFSYPTHTKALTNVFDVEPILLLELGRLVLLDEVEANGESWFVSRCFDYLRREGMVGIVSFSDPVPRTTEAGEVVAPGHIGFVYQALSACYLGRSAPRTLRLLPDGRVIHERAIQKIRGGERGWRYAARPLEEFGASPAPSGDKTAWLGYWLARLTRKLPHGGNHKYAWALERAARKLLPDSRPYPKVTVPQLHLW